MRDKPDTRRVAQLASTQRGLVRFDQLQALGFIRQEVERLVAIGFLHPIHRGVYAVGHTALTERARYLAATYALGDDSALGHKTAGAHLAICSSGGRIDVIVPTYNGHLHRDNIRIHRQRLRREEVAEFHGVRCTTVCRTIMDIAASTPWLLDRAFEEAQVRHQLSPAELAAELVMRRGHRGTTRLRALLVDAVEPGDVESILELRYLKLCHDFTVPRPETQVWFGNWRADFYYPEQRVVIETDGRLWHASAAKRRRDAQKTAELEQQGELVLRLRWTDVIDAPAATAERVLSTLNAR
jgi:very-short-patch-repair endonuclease/predicted transcriptional regulator of viral defense system